QFALYTLGQALLNARHCDRALGAGYELLHLAEINGDPNAIWAHHLLGQALECMGKLPDAEMQLKLASQGDPGDATIAAELQSVRQRLASPTSKQ
ncbi:MAG TPA: hypothetical protein VKK61_02100, partial [Tepidisphaeraceae bacterium]|nr:hypothetical protein [Tepidisphaeraceae bacterium]